MNCANVGQEASSVIERLVAVHTFLRRSARVVHADVTVEGSFVDKSRPTLLAHFSLGYYVQMFSVHVDLLVALTFKAKAADLTSKSFPAEVNVLHVKLQGSFGTQPLLTMVTLELNFVVDGLSVFFQFDLLNSFELASLFGAIDDFEPVGCEVVLLQPVTDNPQPDLTCEITDVASGNVAVVNPFDVSVEKLFMTLDLGLAQGANVCLFTALGLGFDDLHVQTLVRVVAG